MLKRRIIIADDDEDDRALVISAFRELRPDLTIDCAVDGSELMEILTKGKHQEAALFILLDLNMPRMDGREVLLEMKKNPSLKKIPVIVFTTARNEAEIRRCYELGANTYIVKPDSLVELRKVVSNLSAYWKDTATVPI